MNNIFEANLFTRKTVGDYSVYDNSLLFRAGTFPERIVNGKPLTVTSDQIAMVVKNFHTPVSGNIGHLNYLKGRALHILSVSQSGDELRGTVAIPTLLDQLINDDERRLSVELDPSNFDRLIGAALCTNPRITDAMLMTAEEDFAKAKHTTLHGQNALQNIHDMAARSGAICIDGDKDQDKMVSKGESKSMQDIHDKTLESGASCSSMGYGYYVDMPLDRTTLPVQPFQDVLGHITHETQISPTEGQSATSKFITVNKDKKPMKLSEMIKSLFSGKSTTIENDLDDTVLDPSGVVHKLESVEAKVDITKTAEFIAKDKEAADLKSKLDQLEADKKAQFTKDNEAVVDQLIKIGKFDPKDKAVLLERRATNFTVFDQMVEMVPVKSEYLNANTVSADQVRDQQDGKIDTKKALEANRAALSKLGVGL